jgi:hypothetical protein
MVVSTIDRVDKDVKWLCKIKTYEDWFKLGFMENFEEEI